MERDELIKAVHEIDEARRACNQARKRVRAALHNISIVRATQYEWALDEADDKLNNWLQDLAKQHGFGRDYMYGWGYPEGDPAVDHTIEDAQRELEDAADQHTDPYRGI